jgi:hypothetical protein
MHIIVSRDSAVCIRNRYGPDGLGIESRWGVRSSASVQTDSGAHPASCKMGTVSFPQVKRPGCDYLNQAPRLKKEYSYTFTSPMSIRGLF